MVKNWNRVRFSVTRSYYDWNSYSGRRLSVRWLQKQIRLRDDLLQLSLILKILSFFPTVQLPC